MLIFEPRTHLFLKLSRTETSNPVVNFKVILLFLRIWPSLGKTDDLQVKVSSGLQNGTRISFLIFQQRITLQSLMIDGDDAYISQKCHFPFHYGQFTYDKEPQVSTFLKNYRIVTNLTFRIHLPHNFFIAWPRLMSSITGDFPIKYRVNVRVSKILYIPRLLCFSILLSWK